MTAQTQCEKCGKWLVAFDPRPHPCTPLTAADAPSQKVASKEVADEIDKALGIDRTPPKKTEVEILRECLFAAQNAAIDLAKKNQALEKDLALKTRDRDVFREFTLAYEARIVELEKQVMMYRTDAEKLTMRIIDSAVSAQIRKAQEK